MFSKPSSRAAASHPMLFAGDDVCGCFFRCESRGLMNMPKKKLCFQRTDVRHLYGGCRSSSRALGASTTKVHLYPGTPYCGGPCRRYIQAGLWNPGQSFLIKAAVARRVIMQHVGTARYRVVIWSASHPQMWLRRLESSAFPLASAITLLIGELEKL